MQVMSQDEQREKRQAIGNELRTCADDLETLSLLNKAKLGEPTVEHAMAVIRRVSQLLGRALKFDLLRHNGQEWNDDACRLAADATALATALCDGEVTRPNQLRTASQHVRALSMDVRRPGAARMDVAAKEGGSDDE